MTKENIRDILRQRLAQIAPEVDFQSIDPLLRFRDQFDFDSVDFLNLALGLQEDLSIRIPENDYPKLASLDSCVAYLQAAVEQERAKSENISDNYHNSRA
jgi:acyl carrier protein